VFSKDLFKVGILVHDSGSKVLVGRYNFLICFDFRKNAELCVG
jgi:hypothetical protein